MTAKKRALRLHLMLICLVLTWTLTAGLLRASDNVLTQKTAAEILEMVPTYDGSPSVDINGDVPFFAERMTTAFDGYGPLDSLGRCTVAFACVGPETMPDASRERISEIHPTGWSSARYAGIEGENLYNRCHLIGYQLTGQNANERNLITGTRYLNVEGMLPFENSVGDYIRETGNHVMYRVTPVFSGDNLVASGVLMEARSVEDPSVQFCAYCYNVQPGIEIDYATGDSSGEGRLGADGEGEVYALEPEIPGENGGTEGSVLKGCAAEENPSGYVPASAEGREYVLNTNTGKFHYPDCPSVGDIKAENREEYYGSRDDLIAMGFDPCGRCHP